MGEPPHPGDTGVDEHGVLLRSKPDPSQPPPDPALVADDGANLLFYAAAVAADPKRQVRAWRQLGLIDANGAPNAKMTPFIRAHQEWVKLRATQAATVSSPEKARAYLDAHDR